MNENFRTLLFSLVIIILPSSLLGNIFIEILTGRSIDAMEYDSKRALMWFGSSNGALINFDGTTFTQFDASNSGLPDNDIRSLALDRDGNLWVGTRLQGVSRFRVKDNIWDNYDISNGLNDNDVRNIAVDSVGRVWFATRNGGVGVFDGMHWYRFTTTHCAIWTGTDWDTLRIYEAEENRLLDDRVHAIAVDGHRTLWFGTDEGVSKLLLPRESTTNICVDAEWGTGFPIDRVRSVLVDRQGFKWFGSGDGPYKLAKDNVTWALEPTDAPDCVQGTIWSMVEDYEGNLWFGTSDGAPRLDPVNMIWRCSTGSADLDRKRILSLETDEDGNLWFGASSGLGATKFKANWVTFSPTNDDSLKALTRGKEDTLSLEIITTTLDRSNQVWIGTDNGIARFKDNIWHPKRYFEIPTDVRNSIRGIFEASDGTLYLGSFGGGVLHIQSNATLIENLTVQNTKDDCGGGLTDNRVRSLIVDGKIVWIGTERGLCRFDSEDQCWQCFNTDNSGLLSNRILALTIDLEGNLWVGTAFGLSKYDGNEWVTFTTGNTDGGLGSDGILSVTVDSTSGRIWVGTAGGGASSFLDGKWNRFTIFDGLVDNVVQDIQILDEGREVWFATPTGVSLLNGDGQWTTFTTVDGLADNDVTKIQQGVRSGEIWFGTRSNGVTRYRRQPKRPDTDILNPIDITANTDISYRFIGKDLNTDKSLLRYSYKVDNDPWSDYSFDTFASISATSDGPHTFYVRAIDRDGNVDSTAASDFFYKITTEFGGEAVISNQENTVRLHIPPGELPDTTRITISSAEDAITDDPLAIVAYEISVQPETFVLKRPTTLAISIPAAKASQDTLAIFRQTEDRSWVHIGGTLTAHEETLTISTSITEFGIYAVRHVSLPARTAPQEPFMKIQPRVINPNTPDVGFGAKARISFTLEQPSTVTVKVYDLGGRLVRNLVESRTLFPGANVVEWNGRDRDGKPCSSGLYIVLLQTDGKAETMNVLVSNSFQ